MLGNNFNKNTHAVYEVNNIAGIKKKKKNKEKYF